MEVYLDLENATPLPEPVLKAMLPYFGERAYGHSALTHRVGWEAYAAVEESLGRLALALGVPSEELAVTHDAVEAANLAFEGLVVGRPVTRRTVVLSAIEPLNVMYAAEKLEQHGFKVVKVPVDAEGFVREDALAEACTADTHSVAVSWVSHEIGTVQRLDRLAAIVRERAPEAVFVSDLSDAFGRLPFEGSVLPVDIGIVTSYKVFGPRGAAALFRGKRARLKPLIAGPYSTQPLWPGDENLPILVGFAEAAEAAVRDLEARTAHMRRLRDRLIDGLLAIPHTVLNGPRTERAPDNANISFLGAEGEAITVECSDAGVYVSSGSACTRRMLQPSHVLLAVGRKYEAAHGSILMKISPFHTDADIDHVLKVFPAAIERLRKLSGFKEA
jgi:cysteine desulfurase